MKRWWNTPRIDPVELAVLLGVVGVVAFLAGAHRAFSLETETIAEGDELARKYGPDRNSEHAEEWIVRDFFNDRRGGFFVDVGANDYKKFNNTYYLETSLGGLPVHRHRTG